MCLPNRRRASNGAHHRRHQLLARAGHRRSHRPGQDARAVLGAAVRGLRIHQAVDGRRTRPTSCSSSTTITPPRSASTSFRRSRSVALTEFAPADEGWGARPVPVVQGAPELAAHISAERDPAGLRSHHRQQDGCGSRPDRAAVADVRPAESLAVPRDPVRGERRAVSAAVRPSLLPAGQGDAARDRKFRSRISTCRSGARAA